MKRLLLLVWLLAPSAAFGADDVTISVRINYSNLRIEPKRELKKSFWSYQFLLHPDGTVEEAITSPGQSASAPRARAIRS